MVIHANFAEDRKLTTERPLVPPNPAFGRMCYPTSLPFCGFEVAESIVGMVIRGVSHSSLCAETREDTGLHSHSVSSPRSFGRQSGDPFSAFTFRALTMDCESDLRQ